MQIDPRLNDIDDCLYRVAVRALITQNNRILLVQEIPEMWWAFPGGGIDHGENIESSLIREVEEELGVPPEDISSDFKIAHYDIGNVVNAVPRMNLFFKISVSESSLKKTSHVAMWKWFTKGEFLALNIHPSYDKIKLANIVFGS